MLPQDNITYLVGSSAISTKPLKPYDDLTCDFLDSLSRELLASPETKKYPDVLTFAFWCRRANLARLKANFEDGKHRLGLGLAFHVAPSNVPVNFAFSFAFGILAGNANIVRLPSKNFPQIDIICRAINTVFLDIKFEEIKAMTAFVRYEANENITGSISSNCRARIIWGGDQTIRTIRQQPLPVRGIEIAFPDRYSFCVIDAPSILRMKENELDRLAEHFYNDTYLMDQNACSSPHLVIWCGENKEKGKELFWSAVTKKVSEKYQLAAASAVDKYVQFCNDAISLKNIKDFDRHGNHVYRVTLSHLPDDMDTIRGKFGYFYEYDTDDLGSIARIINSKYQTLTFFGMEKAALVDFVIQHRLSGIDRIVAIGKALEIDVVWDGHNIVQSLSRVISVN